MILSAPYSSLVCTGDLDDLCRLFQVSPLFPPSFKGEGWNSYQMSSIMPLMERAIRTTLGPNVCAVILSSFLLSFPINLLSLYCPQSYFFWIDKLSFLFLTKKRFFSTLLSIDDLSTPLKPRNEPRPPSYFFSFPPVDRFFSYDSCNTIIRLSTRQPISHFTPIAFLPSIISILSV